MSLKYKHTILLVDDDESVMKSLQRLFHKDGYQVITAPGGQQGLETLRGIDKTVSLIIADQRMPGMTGAQFLEEAKKIFPDAVRFLMTGFPDMNAIIDAINKGEIHRYLSKPWNDYDLMLNVRQSLEQFEMTVENKRLLALTRKQNKELDAANKDLEKTIQERTREVIEKNKELEENFFNTIRAFASLAEMHAPSLGGHGRRVSLLSREIAQHYKLAENEAIHIEIAGLMHDIGKLGFSQKLMDYDESKWTPEDTALYQKHPEEGQTIVRFISRLEPVGALIRSHHERYDGQGYPDGLSEDDIPIGAKIISVADIYDKIVNLKVNVNGYIKEYLDDKKVAHGHLPKEELVQQAAIYHLKQQAFTSYDPDVVKVFLNLLKKKGITYRTEKKTPIDELQPGMIVSRPVYTSRGLFLHPYNTVLTEEHIDRLEKIKKNNQISKNIFIIAK